jgi:hypothetical protein
MDSAIFLQEAVGINGEIAGPADEHSQVWLL